MRDPRLQELAHNLVHYSISLQTGEKALVEMIGAERELLKCVVEEINAVGGVPYVLLSDNDVQRSVMLGATKEALQFRAELDLARMRQMDAYIGIRAYHNINDLSDVPAENMKLHQTYYYKPVHLEQRVKRTKWAVLRYPNAPMAQMAGMSTTQFEDFYFNVCNLDYRKMSAAMTPLIDLMNRTDKVRITAPGTDLSFSIQGIPAVKCDGHRNIPDGECYTAPVRDSINGTLAYNAPTVYSDISFENVRFRFENGKIVEASASDSKRLNDILDSDEGARYIGEFSLGFNPHIKTPMKDILFDEKIDGSLHFTPGQAYDEADNGNRSVIHWDLVLIQRSEYGGGEVYFDDRLIRKDGRFVVKELEGLNPENLL